MIDRYLTLWDMASGGSKFLLNQEKSVKLKRSKVLQKPCGKNSMAPPRGVLRTLLITYDRATRFFVYTTLLYATPGCNW